MELLTLTWLQVDFEQKVVCLLDTKNGTARVLPLTERALELMHDHFMVRRADTMLAFPGKVVTSTRPQGEESHTSPAL